MHKVIFAFSENLMRRLHMRTIIHYFQPMLVNNLVCVCVGGCERK